MRVNHLFTCICEVDRDQIASSGLHLANAPMGVLRVADEHAGGKDKMTHAVMNTGAHAQSQSTIAQDELAALIASRICHDLVSPMGAIGNGLELLQLSKGVSGPEIDLIEQSITQANTRLRLYRLAFGAVGDGQMIAHGEIASLLEALSAQGRHAYQWIGAASFNRRYSKLVFLLVLCLETALPWGGMITIEDAAGRLQLEARSERMKLDEPLWQMLVARMPTTGLNAAKVHFGLLAQEMQAQGMILSMQREPGLLRLHLQASPGLQDAGKAEPPRG